MFFFATGTGESPHNAMIAELLARGHRGKIISTVSVRYLRDAAYRECHAELMRRYPNYLYFVLTTRESGATDLAPMPAAGKRHLQDLVHTGELESRIHVSLDPKNAHVFLCGSPDMIGAGHPHPSRVPPRLGGMLDLLMRRGFLCDQPEQSGNVHFERYW